MTSAQLLKEFGSKSIDIDAMRRHFHTLPTPGIDYVPPLRAVSIIEPERVLTHHAEALAAADYQPWDVSSEGQNVKSATAGTAPYRPMWFYLAIMGAMFAAAAVVYELWRAGRFVQCS